MSPAMPSIGSPAVQSVATCEEASMDDILLKSTTSIQKEFFSQEPCIYSHKVYESAARVFHVLRQEPDDLMASLDELDYEVPDKNRRTIHVQNDAVMQDESEAERRLTFELAFSTLKYQSLLLVMLEDCVFFSLYPEFQEDDSLVMVIFYDFQARKFQRRKPFDGEDLNECILAIEDALVKCKTKLNASLARNRIKHQAINVEFLLPEKIRGKREESAKMPLSAWVNQLKTNLSDVEERLMSDGFVRINSSAEFIDKTYCVDRQLNDLLIFSSKCRDVLPQHELVEEGSLVLQDKSNCLAPHTIKKLLGKGGDVIHVNAGLGNTTAHIASLCPETKVFAYSSKRQIDQRNTLARLHQLGASNVKLVKENFLTLTNDDSKMKSVRVIFITAACSKTAINNPIDFIVHEGEDMNILRDLSFGTNDNRKMTRLAAKQTEILRHALTC